MKYFKSFESLQKTKGKTFWGTIGAGVLPICLSTKRILVGLRSESVLEPLTWGTFGGKLDIDEGINESIKEAVLRELEEEVGFNGKIKLIDAYVYKHGNFEYHNFFGLVSKEFKPTLNWENDDAVWMSFEQLENLPNKHFGLISLLKESDDILKSLFI